MWKRISDLCPEDFADTPVWEFCLDDECDDELVVPVDTCPVTSLVNRVVGTRIRLSNGDIRFAAFSNVDLESPYQTRHFLTLSVFNGGHWLHLARYHDPDYERHGPSWIAKRLGLSVSDVFPITYDLRACCAGHVDTLVGVIPRDIQDKLAPEELMALILSSSEIVRPI